MGWSKLLRGKRVVHMAMKKFSRTNTVKYKVTCLSCGSVLGFIPSEFLDDPNKVPDCKKCPFSSQSVEIIPLGANKKLFTKRWRVRCGKKHKGKFPEETDKKFGEKYTKTGEVQTIERIYDRINDKYREVIVNSDGKVVKIFEERLSNHRNTKKSTFP